MRWLFTLVAYQLLLGNGGIDWAARWQNSHAHHQCVCSLPWVKLDVNIPTKVYIYICIYSSGKFWYNQLLVFTPVNIIIQSSTHKTNSWTPMFCIAYSQVVQKVAQKVCWFFSVVEPSVSPHPCLSWFPYVRRDQLTSDGGSNALTIGTKFMVRSPILMIAVSDFTSWPFLLAVVFFKVGPLWV